MISSIRDDRTGKVHPVTHIVAPAAWASYLVNGDASGLSAEEKAQADAWLEREGVRIVDVERDEEGNGRESYWCTSLWLHAPEFGFAHGDALDYRAEELRLEEDSP